MRLVKYLIAFTLIVGFAPVASVYAFDLNFNTAGDFTSNFSTADSPSTDWFEANGIGLEDPGPGASRAVDIGPNFGGQAWTLNTSMPGNTSWQLTVFFSPVAVENDTPFAVGFTTDKSNTYAGTGAIANSFSVAVDTNTIVTQRYTSTTRLGAVSWGMSELTPGNWYQLRFNIAQNGSNVQFSNVAVFNASADGTVGSQHASIPFAHNVGDSIGILADPETYIFIGNTSHATGGIAVIDNLSTTAPVPEPSTYALLIGLGTILFVVYKRFRHSCSDSETA